MRQRFGANAGGSLQPLAYGETVKLGPVSVKLVPAGHILGSAQAVLEKGGSRIVVSGDYKRRPDPTCPPFEPQPCDIFITEATFGLPVFRHPDDGAEIDRLLHSLRLFPERAHLVGAYALGKCQRVIALLRRRATRSRSISTARSRRSAISMKNWRRARPAAAGAWRGEGRAQGQDRLGAAFGLGGALGATLARSAGRAGFGLDARQATRQGQWRRAALVISDHADWDELTGTIDELKPSELWITHGAEEALLRQAGLMGYRARALSLVGFEDEE